MSEKHTLFTLVVMLLLVATACLLAPRRTPTPTPIPPVPTSGQTGADAIVLSDHCSSVVADLHQLIDSVEFPERLAQGDYSRQPGDFDPNRYFTILAHLRMEDGYALDYVYNGNEMGGRPVIYVRKMDADPFRTYEEYLSTTGGVEPTSPAVSFRSGDYLQHVQVDGSPESYLEYNILSVYADRFYQFWHANYNDWRVVCSSADVELINQDITSHYSELSLPENVVQRAMQADLNPSVVMTDGSVSVRYVVFSKWGGFVEKIYTMDRNDPFHLVGKSENTIIQYNCGIMF